MLTLDRPTKPTKILPLIDLRPDQQQARTDIYEQWATHDNVLCVASTGFGKTVLAAKIALDFINSPNKEGELWIALHRIALIDSTLAALVNMGIPTEEITYYWSDFCLPIHGVTPASRKARIKVVMIPTLEAWAKPGSGNEAYCTFEHTQIRCLIMDEAHITSMSGMGVNLIQSSKKVLGLTATPILADPWRSLGEHYHSVVLTTSHGDLVARGDLRIFHYHSIKVDELAEGEAIKDEDEELSRVAKQLEDPKTLDFVIKNVEKLARDYAKKNNGVRKTAVFAPSQASAIKIAQEWGRRLGAGRVGYVLSDGCAIAGDSETSRRAIENRFGDVASGLDVLISCTAIAVGFDKPATSIAVLLRKLSGPSLIQSLGRACRRFRLCSYSLAIDFFKNFRSDTNPNGFAPVEELAWDAKEILKIRHQPDKGESPTKLCPVCSKVLASSAKVCRESDGGCGHEFLVGDDNPTEARLEQLHLEKIMSPFWVLRGSDNPSVREERLIEAVQVKWGALLRTACGKKQRGNKAGEDPYPILVQWLKDFRAQAQEWGVDLPMPADMLSHKYLSGDRVGIRSFAPKYREERRIHACYMAVMAVKGAGAYTAYWRLVAIEIGAERARELYEGDDTEPGFMSVFRQWWVGGVMARVKFLG